jgi:1,2-phenylacetyl-CoA epoxidase catalytic subunit
VKDAIHSADSPALHDLAPRRLLDLIGALQAAKLGAAAMYTALAQRMPTVEASLAVRHLAEDEVEHAAALGRLTVGPEAPPSIGAAVAPGCGLYDEDWPSALMAAFALDQAATAALLGIAGIGQGPVADTAAHIADEERSHQSFAIAAFKSVADTDPAAGRRLAAEMLVARDWVKQVFPRHTILAALAAEGVLPSDAARVHDSFLASLGDRVQEALGVLGD